jgi:hypothetical protein
MTNLIPQLDALDVVKTLFWGSILTALACFLTDRYLQELLGKYLKPLLIGIALVLIWRIPTEGGFFHGIEYEDSYVYTVAARQMAGHFRIEPRADSLPYSINVCVVGSLTSCRQSDNYPQHLIGYPFTLSVFFNIFGYRPCIGSIVNVLCACLVDILVFLLCIVIADDAIAAGSAALIFAITPVFAVWGLETSAEPISNGCIVLAIWFCLRYVYAPPTHNGRWRQILTWCAFTATLLFSLTVKRENILLTIALPAIIFLVQPVGKHSLPCSIRRSWWIVFSAIIGLILSLQLHLSQTQNSEIALLKKFPLTATELISFLPVFVSSFFAVQWYGCAVILVTVGATVACRHRNLSLFPLLLFGGYVLVYAFHLRTYYEMQSGTTDARAALRFSMSLMGLWSILAGLGTASILSWLQGTRIWKVHQVSVNWVMGCAVAAIVGVSFFATNYFREDVVEDEFRMRIEPSLTTVQIAAADRGKKTYILTLEPLILQMYAEPRVDVLSLRALNGAAMKEIGFDEGTVDVLYLDERIHRNPVDAERYKSQFECLNLLRHSIVTSESIFSVIRIDTMTPGQPNSGNRVGSVLDHSLLQ